MPSESPPYIEEMSVVFIIFKCFYSTFRLMLKDTILCPWNNLHWVVGRAELLVAVDSGVCSLKN